MGFWNKLGKIALSAAPYVAAPFTGGLSLAATGLTNKAVANWSAKDAAKAEAKGLAPSNFDKVLGKVNAGAGLASSFLPTGALGSVGKLSSAVGGASKAANIATKAGKTASNVLGGSYNGPSQTNTSTPPFNGGQSGVMNGGSRNGGTDWSGLINQGINMAGDAFANRGGQSRGQSSGGIGPSGAMPRGNQVNQAVPRASAGGNNAFADALTMGRSQAIQNQPFRAGYDVKSLVGTPDENGKYEERITRMPAIKSDLIGGSRSGRMNKKRAS